MEMWASFTSGTYHFLQQLTNKHTTFEFHFMRSNRSILVYYEHKRKKSIFVSGNTYSVLHMEGTFYHKGYVTMEHVPVTDDGVKAFEDRLQQLFPDLIKRTGVVAMRILKNKQKNEYIMMTQWKNKRYEQLWRESSFYKEQNIQQFARISAYFAERPFTNEFYMIDEDEEEETFNSEDD